MKIYYESRFRRQYKKLLASVQDLAEEKEKLFRVNPFDPKLKTHKLHGKFRRFWAFWVDDVNRVIFKFISENHVEFHQIGDHDIYD